MSGVAPRIEIAPVESPGPANWETAVFTGGIAVFLGLVLALIVVLPMRRYARTISRPQFARRAVWRAALIQFILLAGFSAFMRGWQHTFSFLWEMHWLAWLVVGISLVTVWLVAFALAPSTRIDTTVFD